VHLGLTLPGTIAPRKRSETHFAAHVPKMLQTALQKQSERHFAAKALEILAEVFLSWGNLGM